MARESLILIASMFAISGCLVADPPEYQPPEQTPPLIDMFRIDPQVSVILTKRPGDTIPFNVPIRSEDAGDSLLGALFLDLRRPEDAFKANQGPPATLDASTFDDEDRFMTFNWTVPSDLEGCHHLSLIVCHQANFDPFTFLPKEGDDKAKVVWWLDVTPVTGGSATLGACPKPSDVGMP